MITPIILADGSNPCLLPFSRGPYPKRFLNLVDANQILFQQTIRRVRNLDITTSPIVICNDENRFAVAKQSRQIDIKPQTIIPEPAEQNTTPAVAFYSKAGYGYIQQGSKVAETAFSVQKFAERPDSDTTQKHIDSGEFYWNDGMFAFSPNVFLQELKSQKEDIYTAVEKAFGSKQQDLVFTSINKTEFDQCRSSSIDDPVVERSQQVLVLGLDTDWSDVGVRPLIWDVSDKDDTNNTLLSDELIIDVENSLIQAEKKFVAVIGVKDLIVVETDDALLASGKAKSQDFKNIVAYLKANDREEIQPHTRTYRQQGWHESIYVNPGSSLSLQMLLHRAAHWIAPEGTAKITKGEEILVLTKDQSTYISLGPTHRLENPGIIPREINGVQTGSHLGEDDIVRFEGMYGR